MQFITIIPTERYARDEAGQKIRQPGGQLLKQKVPAGTVFDGEANIDLVVHGVAVPKDDEAKALCRAKGIDPALQIKGRQILETVDLVKVMEPPK